MILRTVTILILLDAQAIVGNETTTSRHHCSPARNSIRHKLEKGEKIFIVSAGMPRSSSTWLFNTIKCTLLRQNVSNLNGTRFGYTSSNRSKRLTENTTVFLKKTHEFSGEDVRRADLVFTSFRSPVDTARSLLGMDMGKHIMKKMMEAVKEVETKGGSLSTNTIMIKAGSDLETLVDRHIKQTLHWKLYSCPCCTLTYNMRKSTEAVTAKLVATLGFSPQDVNIEDIIQDVERLTRLRTRNGPSANLPLLIEEYFTKVIQPRIIERHSNWMEKMTL
eukprot:m.12488 g.12488  ORF g.12488 m.12488 type:complete len:277 (-) comp4660_c0_seq1:49-879(-)